ncbi:cytochrome P450 [Wolfiporia cocos MD-104 SS10]|uniref:Cytochrome P450 n=1 Tax=Wolfiporia cocos (strain MD-104) TaxID=742152 RepID=A0A2H3JBS2_WOLCO|nr:cytochrome P450 [Wolfiporia cocos MD-104 SS10]
MARDPTIYTDPKTFRPERFMEMDPEEAELKDPRQFVFGFGRRVCPGRNFADANVWLAIACITAVFDIRKSRDADGAEITPEAYFSSGFVSHPHAFVCDILPRP